MSEQHNNLQVLATKLGKKPHIVQQYRSLSAKRLTSQADATRLAFDLATVLREADFSTAEIYTVLSHMQAITRWVSDADSLSSIIGTTDTKNALVALDKRRSVRPVELLSADERALIPHTHIDSYVSEMADDKGTLSTEFYYANGITVLSQVLGEYGVVQYRDGGKVDRLNPWFLGMAPSSKGRKTTVFMSCLRILRDLSDRKTADNDEIVYQYELTNDGSPESIELALANRPGRSGLFYRDEAQDWFVDQKTKTWQSGLQGKFNNWYEGYTGKVTRIKNTKDGRKLDEKQSVPVNFGVYIMGVYEELYKVLTPEQWTTGYLHRYMYMIFTPPAEEKRVYVPALVGDKAVTADDMKRLQEREKFRHLTPVEERFVHWMRMVRGNWASKLGMADPETKEPNVVSVAFDTSESALGLGTAQDLFQRVMERAEKILLDPHDPLRKVHESHIERFAANMLKISALIAMSNLRPYIQLQDVLWSANFMERRLQDYLTFIKVVYASTSEELDRIEAWLLKQGGSVARTALHRYLYQLGHDIRSMNDTISMLITLGKAEIDPLDSTKIRAVINPEAKDEDNNR